MIAFDCECGEPLSAAPEHAGMRVRCPSCGRALAVPVPEADIPPARRKKAVPVDDDRPVRRPKRRPQSPPPAPPRDPVRQLMDRAHAELEEDEARRAREWRPVTFTPGMIGGVAVFIVCSILGVLALAMLQLYLAIGLFCFAVLGLVRAVLSYLGRGVD